MTEHSLFVTPESIWKWLSQALEAQHLLSKYNVIPHYCPCSECRYHELNTPEAQ